MGLPRRAQDDAVGTPLQCKLSANFAGIKKELQLVLQLFVFKNFISEYNGTNLEPCALRTE